jgi:hypothetical protein
MKPFRMKDALYTLGWTAVFLLVRYVDVAQWMGSHVMR